MSKLVKAQLISTDGGGTIEFMFNPNQLAFSQQINLTKDRGARTGRGLPKVSFAYPEPCSLTINDIVFDTYEEGSSVLKHIKPFEKALNFAESGPGKEKRPPTYVFTWGSQQYIRCFITNLTYNLTLFLPDGTPVRAKINLTLEEIDESTSQPGMGTPRSSATQRQQDSLANRKASQKSSSGAAASTSSPTSSSSAAAPGAGAGAGAGGGASSGAGAAAQAAGAASQAAGAAGAAAAQAAGAASQAAGAAGAAAAQAAGAASQAASQAAGAASQAASQAADAASQAAGAAGEAASQAAGAAGEAASQAADAASQAAPQIPGQPPNGG